MVSDEPTGSDEANEEAADRYANHAERLAWVLDDAARRRAVVAAELRSAFARVIETKSTEWIRFDRVTTDTLAIAFRNHPVIIKPITALCNIAGRAIARDLGFTVSTYKPSLTLEQANQLAGYVKPFLPPTVALPALEAIDDWFFIDKEIRSYQGRWESLITQSLTRRTGRTFKKRMFTIEDSSGDFLAFELDAALPERGEPIEVGIDVKRIGSPRDIHKRIDEIVNKAVKFKHKYLNGKFGSVIYYPFDSVNQTNIVNRIRSSDIDGVVFVPGESPASVVNAVLLLIPQLGMDIVDDTEPASLFDDIRGSE